MSADVIVLEFNELTPVLIDRFISEARLPNFKILRDQSITAITEADESPPFLEPWIQWVTVHTGLPYSRHGCFDLNDGARFKAPRIWDIVSNAGGRVWICGSMNAGVMSDAINGLVLPDPWATEVKAVPEAFFEPYERFVRAHVQEHSKGKAEVSKQDIVRFGKFMMANGLSARTVWTTIRQLVGEFGEKINWRRATILDQLQWDVFRSIYKETQPALSTFFLNSTAHFQHFHWREMEPEIFSIQASEYEKKMYRDAIGYGYEQMDKLVGEALNLAGSETSIVLATALSQKPMLTHEENGGRQLFRHHNHKALLAYAGVTELFEYSPIMSQQFVLRFGSGREAISAAQKIEALRLDDGQQVMLARRDGDQVLSGCMIEAWPAKTALVTSGASNEVVYFSEMFYPLEALRSGMHHPDGVLWVRTPTRRRLELKRKISLLEVAPTLVALAGVKTDHVFERAPIAEVVERLVQPLVAA
jgi:hypothetical protein